MAFKNRTGPPERNRRAPRKRVGLAATRDRNRAVSIELQEQVRHAVRELQDAGAVFGVRHDMERGWVHTYRVTADGSEATCKAIMSRALGRQEPFPSLFRVAAFAAGLSLAWGLSESGGAG